MDWLEEYCNRGFVVFANLLPPSLIDAHVAEVAALLQKYGVTGRDALAALTPEADDALMLDMLALHRNSTIAVELIHQRILTGLLRQLFQAEPMLSMAFSSFWEAEDMRAHVDAAFRAAHPPYAVCRTYCVLEDIDPYAGGFYLAPGTHLTLTPRLCREVLQEQPEVAVLAREAQADPNLWYRLDAHGWPLVSAKVAGWIDGSHKTIVDLKKGDVIIFNPAVAHGTTVCADPALSRKAMVCEWTTPAAYRREYRQQRMQSADILPFTAAKPRDIRLHPPALTAKR